jgi:phosphoribosylformylglycinamidine cyclo-ligase
MAGLTYRQAGVDIDAGERLVDRIKPLAARTRIPEVLGSVGGFAGLCAVPEDVADPVLVSGTDGVGTKLRLAFELDVHDTVGVDLVAMCVNDVLTVGARPLFFLDYFATSALDVTRAEQVVRGIASGCEQAGCALLGGETAELPGFYAEGEYELAGFAVGVVSRSAMLDGQAARPGDVVLGVASSGLHSNGYSLARKALLEAGGYALSDRIASVGGSLGEALLMPTRIYANAVRVALETGGVKALCHVTGGGLPGNIPRVLPDGLGVRLDPASWVEPPIFDLVRKAGSIDEPEMRRAFNLGVGLCIVAAPERADDLVSGLREAGETVTAIGEVEPGADGAGERVRFPSP